MDYEALAKQYGGTSGTAPPVDYAALAKQFGGMSGVAAKYTPEASPPGMLATLGGSIGKGIGDVALGAQRYLGKGLQAVGADKAGQWLVNDAETGKANMAEQLAPYKSANPMTATVGETAGNVLATLPVGGALAIPVKAAAKVIPALAPIGNAISSAGFTTGVKAAPGAAGLASNMLTRAAGGAVTGGASAGLVDPNSAAMGAGIGAVLPPAIAGLGKAGVGVANAWREMRGSGNEAGAQALVKALGSATPEQQSEIVASLRAAEQHVPGPRPTVAQALRTPEASTLEAVVSDSPGGVGLKSVYADQAKARMQALQNHGAQTYLGAPAEESTRFGDKAGAVLRTQAADERAAAADAWQALYGRAQSEGTSLRIPLSAMDEAMGPLGRGTVGEGQKARSLMSEAHNIGTIELPPIKATSAGTAPYSLAQAVRAAGGISRINNDGLRGEVVSLQGDLKNLVRVNGGMPPDRMAEAMHEAGFIGTSDASTLFDALRMEARGRPQYSASASGMDRISQAGRDAALGDVPNAIQRAEVPVPFSEFQRLRRSAGSMGKEVADKHATEAGVLGRIEQAMQAKADEVASGTLRADEAMSPGFGDQYNSARRMTRTNAERYEAGNNIEQILRKPYGQNYTLTGDEITNKLWHGGTGLVGDVSNLKQVLSDNNLTPILGDLQKFVMTDAAGKTTGAGNLAAALPAYVKSRMPGLRELLLPEQLQALTGVAEDIRRASAADAIGASKGSPSYRNAANALSLGLLDSKALEAAANKVPGIKYATGPALAGIKAWASKGKAESLAGMLGDSGQAANAIEQLIARGGSKQDVSALAQLLGVSASRILPVAVSR